jgi:SOS-response transcriptional repressor LexA
MSPTNALSLTRRMQDCHRFIVEYQRLHDGVGPTYREIAAGIGSKSASGAHRLVDCLVSRGYVRRGPPGASRCLSVLRDRANEIAAEHMAHRFCQGWGLFRIAEEAGKIFDTGITEEDVQAAVALAWIGIATK